MMMDSRSRRDHHFWTNLVQTMRAIPTKWLFADVMSICCGDPIGDRAKMTPSLSCRALPVQWRSRFLPFHPDDHQPTGKDRLGSGNHGSSATDRSHHGPQWLHCDAHGSSLSPRRFRCPRHRPHPHPGPRPNVGADPQAIPRWRQTGGGRGPRYRVEGSV